MWNAGLDEAQAVINIARRNINNLRYADDTTFIAESKEELKSLLVKVKESEKSGLKLNIQKTKIIVSGPIPSWQICGITMATVADFIFLGSKIIADGGCCCEIKRPLTLGRKVMTKLDSILKSRDITLPTKVHLFKAIFFPVVMYGCESWTVKKAECRRTDAFELWCWRRLLRPVDQHLSAAWSAHVTGFISARQLLDHCLLSWAISAYSAANQPLHRRVIIVCQPLEQRLSGAWSAPNHPLHQRLLSRAISTCQALDQKLYTTWSLLHLENHRGKSQ